MKAQRDPWAPPVHPAAPIAGQHKRPTAGFTAWFFAAPQRTAPPWRIIAWWEARRLAFNVIIGVYGGVCLLVTVALIAATGHLQPGEDAVEPLGLLAAPVVVNLLYTLGWLVESAVRTLGFDPPPTFGPLLLKLGLALGLLLCTLPAAIWIGVALIQWLRIPLAS
jgi:hypothetical protein